MEMASSFGTERIVRVHIEHVQAITFLIIVSAYVDIFYEVS